MMISAFSSSLRSRAAHDAPPATPPTMITLMPRPILVVVRLRCSFRRPEERAPSSCLQPRRGSLSRRLSQRANAPCAFQDGGFTFLDMGMPGGGLFARDQRLAKAGTDTSLFWTDWSYSLPDVDKHANRVAWYAKAVCEAQCARLGSPHGQRVVHPRYRPEPWGGSSGGVGRAGLRPEIVRGRGDSGPLRYSQPHPGSLRGSDRLSAFRPSGGPAQRATYLRSRRLAREVRTGRGNGDQ